jgi:hypothetical protein
MTRDQLDHQLDRWLADQGLRIAHVPIPSTPAPLRSPAQQAPHPLGASGPAPITPPAAQRDFADAGISQRTDE